MRTYKPSPGQQYAFKCPPGSNLPLIKNARDADPQAIGEALADIAVRNGGQVPAEAAVQEAQDPNHPAHRQFEWDDRIAGHQFRLSQARALIRIIVEVMPPNEEGEPQTRPAFFNISASATEPQAYHPIEVILNSQDLQARLLKDAERDLRAWENRYRVIVDICALVKAAREALAARRKAIEDGRGTSPPPP